MLSKIKIGHYTDLKNATGCSVLLPAKENVCSAYAAGASPGTREYALLSPKRKVSSIQALLLTGGSAYGLNAALGLVEELEKDNIGYETPFGIVPIVPAAVIFDLNIGNGKIRPNAENARQAYHNASFNNTQQGNIGAGTGALVGKWMGRDYAMKAGLGLAQLNLKELEVSAISVVNAVGDIIDQQGKIIAGAQKNGVFIAEKDKKKRWTNQISTLLQNTVLTAVLTNAQITKQEAYFIAERMHMALARRIIPSHTSYDGDVSFVISIPEVKTSLDTLCAVASEAIEQSIINAVRNAVSLLSFPANKDLF